MGELRVAFGPTNKTPARPAEQQNPSRRQNWPKSHQKIISEAKATHIRTSLSPIGSNRTRAKSHLTKRFQPEPRSQSLSCQSQDARADRQANQPARIARRTTKQGTIVFPYPTRNRCGCRRQKPSSPSKSKRTAKQQPPTFHPPPFQRVQTVAKTEDQQEQPHPEGETKRQQELWRWGSSDSRPSPPPSAIKFKGCSMPEYMRDARQAPGE